MNKVTLVQGENFKLSVPLRVGDVLYTPDSGLVELTLRDSLGTEVTSLSYAFDVWDFVIAPEHLTVASDEAFSNKYLHVLFQSEGLAITTRVLIEVVPFLPLIYTPQDVIELLGVTEQEISLASINLYHAYHGVMTEVEQPLFEELKYHLEDNRLILYKAALDQMPTIEMKALQTHKVDDHSAVRAKLNFPRLRQNLQAEYDKLRAVRFGFEYDVDPFLEVVTTTDIIVGE